MDAAAPDRVAERLVRGLAWAVDELQVAVSERIADMLGRVEGLVANLAGRTADLVGWVGEVADGVAGGIAEAAGRFLGGYFSGGSAPGGPILSPDDHDGPL